MSMDEIVNYLKEMNDLHDRFNKKEIDFDEAIKSAYKIGFDHGNKNLTEYGVANYWYMKGAYDAQTTEPQPVSLDQTMKDFETHFDLQYKSDVSSLCLNKRTKKTNETEAFVDSYIREKGYPPTYSDIADRFRLNSKSAAYARCRHFRHKMNNHKTKA